MTNRERTQVPLGAGQKNDHRIRGSVGESALIWAVLDTLPPAGSPFLEHGGASGRG